MSPAVEELVATFLRELDAIIDRGAKELLAAAAGRLQEPGRAFAPRRPTRRRARPKERARIPARARTPAAPAPEALQELPSEAKVDPPPAAADLDRAIAVVVMGEQLADQAAAATPKPAPPPVPPEVARALFETVMEIEVDDEGAGDDQEDVEGDVSAAAAPRIEQIRRAAERLKGAPPARRPARAAVSYENGSRIICRRGGGFERTGTIEGPGNRPGTFRVSFGGGKWQNLHRDEILRPARA